MDKQPFSKKVFSVLREETKMPDVVVDIVTRYLFLANEQQRTEICFSKEVLQTDPKLHRVSDKIFLCNGTQLSSIEVFDERQRLCRTSMQGGVGIEYATGLRDCIVAASKSGCVICVQVYTWNSAENKFYLRQYFDFNVVNAEMGLRSICQLPNGIAIATSNEMFIFRYKGGTAPLECPLRIALPTHNAKALLAWKNELYLQDMDGCVRLVESSLQNSLSSRQSEQSRSLDVDPTMHLAAMVDSNAVAGLTGSLDLVVYTPAEGNVTNQQILLERTALTSICCAKRGVLVCADRSGRILVYVRNTRGYFEFNSALFMPMKPDVLAPEANLTSLCPIAHVARNPSTTYISVTLLYTDDKSPRSSRLIAFGQQCNYIEAQRETYPSYRCVLAAWRLHGI